jgi:hypothetical protein
MSEMTEGGMDAAERERDRLQEVIARTQRMVGHYELTEGDYLWLVCQVSRLQGEIAGIMLAQSWERKESA